MTDLSKNTSLKITSIIICFIIQKSLLFNEARTVRMLLHEYQVKSLLQRFQIPSPMYYLIESEKDIDHVLQRAHLESGVVKAQIHAGGRGKAGAVRIAKTVEDLQKFSQEILGMKVVNNQTGKEGLYVKKVIITPLVDVEKEMYLAIALDRKNGQHVVIASSQGGMSIEEVAKRMPSVIVKEIIPEKDVLYRYQIQRLLSRLEIEKPLHENFTKIIDGLVRAYFHFDATLLEINPLVITEQKTILALDAKMSVDDNAVFRQPEMKYFIDNSALPQREAQANELDLAYVSLNGSIGCIVNGAGLAMATMDLLHFWGGSPANFLDVGGGATEEKVSKGFDLVISDPNVKAVFVNIFGGIMNCETIAKALVKSVMAYKKSHLKSQEAVPHIILRMEGTNVQGAKRYLEQSEIEKQGIPIRMFSSLDEAAKFAVLVSQR